MRNAWQVPLADGSDQMGSLRNPAAFCHVYGFRPSTGLLPDVLNAALPPSERISTQARSAEIRISTHARSDEIQRAGAVEV